MMQTGDMDIRLEASWAASNCTAGCNPKQITILVQKGTLKAIGSMMSSKESRTLMVLLEAVENILATAEKDFKDAEGYNQFALLMEAEGVIDHLENAQMHKNHLVF